MSKDITWIYDEYTEQILFCKYFIASKLQHNAEMGRCGENILLQELKSRFKMLRFVTGFIVIEGQQSSQCDILVCKPTMHERVLDGGLYLVNPKDCLMVIEVKGNLSISDFEETVTKNKDFAENEATKHIQLTLFSYNTRIAKKTIYKYFGYSYKKTIKSYECSILYTKLYLDYFICLHRKAMNSEERDKQCFFIKDEIENKYNLTLEYPITRQFFKLIESISEL